jgi:hypothetical protein
MEILWGISSFLPFFRGIHVTNLAYEAKKIYTQRHFPEKPEKISIESETA